MLEIVRPDLVLGQVLIGLLQVASEIFAAVAVDLRAGQFDLIQDFAHLRRAERRMAEKVDEVIEGALKVDVIFPKRVIGVEDQLLFHSMPAMPRP